MASDLKIHIVFDRRSFILYFLARLFGYLLLILKYLIAFALIYTAVSLMANINTLIGIMSAPHPDLYRLVQMVLDGWVSYVIAYVVIWGIYQALKAAYHDYVRGKISELEQLAQSMQQAVAVRKLASLLNTRGASIYDFLAAANAYILRQALRRRRGRREVRIFSIYTDPHTGEEYVTTTVISLEGGGASVTLPPSPALGQGGETETQIFGIGLPEQRGEEGGS